MFLVQEYGPNPDSCLGISTGEDNKKGEKSKLEILFYPEVECIFLMFSLYYVLYSM